MDGYLLDNLLPYFVYTNSEGSGQTLQMHWLVWGLAARWCKIKIQMLPTIYKGTSDQGLSRYSKYISPNSISSWNTFCDLGSHCLQILSYQFYKIDTSLNIIESDQTLHDATPGLGLQCLPSLTNCQPQERQRKWRIPRLISCNRCQINLIQIRPGFSCLTWVKLLARNKSPPTRTG